MLKIKRTIEKRYILWNKYCCKLFCYKFLAENIKNILQWTEYFPGKSGCKI